MLYDPTRDRDPLQRRIVRAVTGASVVERLAARRSI
jgi:hypothetical protein